MWLSPWHAFLILILKMTIVATNNPAKRRPIANASANKNRKGIPGRKKCTAESKGKKAANNHK